MTTPTLTDNGTGYLRYTLHVPYNEGFVHAIRNTIHPRYRAYVPDKHCWNVHGSQIPTVESLLIRFFENYRWTPQPGNHLENTS